MRRDTKGERGVDKTQSCEPEHLKIYSSEERT